MLLQAHPTVQSDLPVAQVTASDTGILHVLSVAVPIITHQYWITTRYILPEFAQDHLELGYEMFYFTPFSSEAVWLRLHPGIPITNNIYPILQVMAPSMILSFLLMYTFTPPSTQADNSPSNATVDPTTALTALMTYQLQKNTAMMAQLQRQSCLPLVATTNMTPFYKIHCPPFTKWYRTTTMKPLFLAQVVTYKSEAHYTGVQYLNQTTTATKHLSITISADMPSSLPHAVYSMFL